MEQEYTKDIQYDENGGYYEGESYIDHKGIRYDKFGGITDPNGEYYPPIDDAMSEATGIFDDDDQEYKPDESVRGLHPLVLPNIHNPIVEKSSHEEETPINENDNSMTEGSPAPLQTNMNIPNSSSIDHTTIPQTQTIESPTISSEMDQNMENKESSLKSSQPLSSLPMNSTLNTSSSTSIPSIPQSQPILQTTASLPAAPSVLPNSVPVSTSPSVPITIPPPPPSLLKFLEEHPDSQSLNPQLTSILHKVSSTEQKTTPLSLPLVSPIKPITPSMTSSELTQLSKKYNIDDDLCTTMTQSAAKYTEEELAVEVNLATKRATEEAQTIIAGLGGTIKRLQSESQQYLSKNSELERVNQEMREVINEVYEQLNVIKEEGAVEASKHYQEQIEKIEQSYKQQIVELNNLLNQKSLTIESLKSDISDLNTNQTRLVKELNGTSLECDSFRQKYEECAALRLSEQNTYNNTLKDKSKELDEYIDKYNQMKSALEEERQKINDNIKEINMYTFNQEREKQKYDDKCHEFNELKKNYEDIKSQYNTISVSESSLKEQYTYVYNSYDSLRQQLLTLQNENSELKMSLEGQTAIQNSKQQQEYNNLKVQATKNEQEITRLKILLFDLQDQSTSLQLDASTVVNPHEYIKELSEKITSLQKELLDQINQNESLMKWINDIVTKINSQSS